MKLDSPVLLALGGTVHEMLSYNVCSNVLGQDVSADETVPSSSQTKRPSGSKSLLSSTKRAAPSGSDSNLSRANLPSALRPSS
jgi:hypothetical protein